MLSVYTPASWARHLKNFLTEVHPDSKKTEKQKKTLVAANSNCQHQATAQAPTIAYEWTRVPVNTSNGRVPGAFQRDRRRSFWKKWSQIPKVARSPRLQGRGIDRFLPLRVDQAPPRASCPDKSSKRVSFDLTAVSKATQQAEGGGKEVKTWDEKSTEHTRKARSLGAIDQTWFFQTKARLEALVLTWPGAALVEQKTR